MKFGSYEAWKRAYRRMRKSECGMRKIRIWTRRRLVERGYGEARMR